jgi:hypothetical protein
MMANSDSYPQIRSARAREFANVLRSLATAYERFASYLCGLVRRVLGNGLDTPVDTHFRIQLHACELLTAEHGSKHEPGSRVGLCPRCSAGS